MNIKNKQLGSCVRFKYLGKNNKLIKDFGSKICFSEITYSTVPKGVETIIIYSSDKQTAYSEYMCRKWFNLIKSFGFDFKYSYSRKSKEHRVIIPINEKNQKRGYLYSILMFARCITEYERGYLDNTCDIPKLFFKFEKKLKIESLDDKFKLLQFVHQFIKGNSNHRIRDCNPETCLSLKEIMERIEDTKSIHTNGRLNITRMWEGEFIKTQKDFDIACGNKKDILKVHVVGGNNHYANWLPYELKFVRMEDAGLVIFTGGEDVDPSFYNEPKGLRTGSNKKRDIFEIGEFRKAIALRKKVLGICRGSQLSCIMAGGKLVQHQNQSGGIHPMETLYENINITSTHHQAQFPFNLPPYAYNIIGWTTNESKIHLDGNENEMNPKVECEIVQYIGIGTLGIQGHPEFTDFQQNYPDDLKVLQQIVKDFLNSELKTV